MPGVTDPVAKWHPQVSAGAGGYSLVIFLDRGKAGSLISDEGSIPSRITKNNLNTNANMNMKIVYIAHPIAGNCNDNVQKVLDIVRQLNLTMPDIVPFAPYISDVLSLDDDRPEERTRGMRNCMAIISSGIVDELWVYGDRISGGMASEISAAMLMGVPIVVKDDRIPDLSIITKL